jgi:hypothetical protein
MGGLVPFAARAFGADSSRHQSRRWLSYRTGLCDEGVGVRRRQKSLMELLKQIRMSLQSQPASDIEERFNLDYHFKHIDTIF